MEYSLIRLNSSTAINYNNLTFAYLQPFLKDLSKYPSIIAIGCARSGYPIGLAIASVIKYQDGDVSAELLSIFVSNDYRSCGVGTALLTAIENELYQIDCRRIILVYRTGKPTTPALEHILKKCHWSLPQTQLLICKATLNSIIDAPWIHRYTLPAVFSTFLWSELTHDERIAIQNKQEVEKWYPESLSPFQESQIIEPLNSLGLRYNGEVVGWMITHRLATDTIRYTALFVTEEFQKMGRAISLLAEAIHLQNNSNIPKGIFCVKPENQPMCGFIKRRMAPYITSTIEARETFKLLQTST
jgi:GNAT superfamily N-acetyltransferase